jgi:hypothetical protein
MGARRFIDADNKLFAIYCHLLDLDPDWAAEKMQARIRKNDLRPLKRFRE